MISMTNKKHRWLRWAIILALFLAIFLRSELSPVDYIPSSVAMTRLVGNNSPDSDFSWNEEAVAQLNQLPGDSADRVAFATFSYVKYNDTKKLFEFLLPAVETWAAPETTSTTSVNETNSNSTNSHGSSRLYYPSLYVVFSNPSREPFEHFCIHGNNITSEQLKLCQRIQPIYVDCPEGRVGESPCCKQQKGLLKLIRNEKHNNYPLYDWYAFFDDDVYLRKAYVAKLLHVLQPPDFPMAATPYNQLARAIGHQKGKVCGGQKGMDEFTYPWGMPIFYSRGAVKMMAGGYASNSLVEQCLAFDVTHDVGNAILNWMYSLPVARLPPLPQIVMDFRDDYIGNHWVGRDDMRKHMNAMGRVSEALPRGAFSFHNTHKKWMEHRQHPDITQLPTMRNPWYRNVTGFTQTDTFILHGDPQSWKEGKWHAMRVEDCDLAGDDEEYR